jgi:hypothetical protein
MYYCEDDPIFEVWRNRAKLLEMYGGLEGYRKHQREERPSLEAQGWKFVTAKEVAARNEGKTSPYL